MNQPSRGRVRAVVSARTFAGIVAPIIPLNRLLKPGERGFCQRLFRLIRFCRTPTRSGAAYLEVVNGRMPGTELAPRTCDGLGVLRKREKNGRGGSGERPVSRPVRGEPRRRTDRPRRAAALRAVREVGKITRARKEKKPGTSGRRLTPEGEAEKESPSKGIRPWAVFKRVRPMIRLRRTPRMVRDAVGAWRHAGDVRTIFAPEGTPNAIYRVWEPNRLLKSGEGKYAKTG